MTADNEGIESIGEDDRREPRYDCEFDVTDPASKIDWWDAEHLSATETLITEATVHSFEGRTIMVLHGFQRNGKQVTQSYMMDYALTYMVGSAMVTSLPADIKEAIQMELRELEKTAGPVPPSADVQSMQVRELANRIAKISGSLFRRDDDGGNDGNASPK